MRSPKCDKDTYTLFLLSEPHHPDATKLADIMGDMSHDAVTRFLYREQFTPKDLFEENRGCIELEGCTLTVDDCVLDKPYSDPKYNDFVTYLYSGLHHQTVKGIGLVTLFCCDREGKRFPVNYRIYEKKEDPKEQRSKNDLFQEMLTEVLTWGLKPAMVTADAWYASVDNMKFLDTKAIPWLFALKENRIVSETAHEHRAIGDIDIPPEGKVVHLKGYTFVKVFRRDFKHDIPKHYATSLKNLSLEGFERHHREHWGIETYHRAIKQLCHAETCMARGTQAQRNHFFCVLRAFSFLEKRVTEQVCDTWYSLKRELYQETVRQFIASQKMVLVNA